jgi:hypothetical protein
MVAGHHLAVAMPHPFPPMTELEMTEYYLQDVSAIVVGARRLAGDLAYIQFLQYYGLDDPELQEEMTHPGFHDETGGRYPRLFELGRRIVRIDPYFNGPILEAAGALEFNQHRTDEATDLLKDGIQHDPYFFRYHLYLAAILFKENHNDRGLMETLLEAIKYPDCPPLFQLILGNLLKKEGRFGDAARVFLYTSQTAPQEYDRKDAVRRLNELLLEHRDAADAIRGAPIR